MKKILFLFTLLFSFLGILLIKNSLDETAATEEKKMKKPSRAKDLKINIRQNILMSLINQHQSLSMKEIERRIQSVNVRTLRRDLDKLQRYGMIIKSGSTKASVYHSNGK